MRTANHQRLIRQVVAATAVATAVATAAEVTMVKMMMQTLHKVLISMVVEMIVITLKVLIQMMVLQVQKILMAQEAMTIQELQDQKLQQMQMKKNRLMIVIKKMQDNLNLKVETNKQRVLIKELVEKAIISLAVKMQAHLRALIQQLPNLNVQLS